MRKHNIDIEDDFIGGQGSLTKTEEKALSDFFRQRKQNIKRSFVLSQNRTSKRTPIHT